MKIRTISLLANMSHAEVFTCLQEKQRFLQIRSISNLVEIGNDNWDMHSAVAALTAGLHQLIDFLQNEK
jgi:hypothetical protein